MSEYQHAQWKRPAWTPLAHGRVGTYIDGCRCEPCRQAHRDYYGNRPLAEHLAAIEPPHGSESRYTSSRWRCRCDECREASRVARKLRRERVAA